MTPPTTGERLLSRWFFPCVAMAGVVICVINLAIAVLLGKKLEIVAFCLLTWWWWKVVPVTLELRRRNGPQHEESAGRGPAVEQIP